MVIKNMCPDTSWPLRNLGTPLVRCDKTPTVDAAAAPGSCASASEAFKKNWGCVSAVNVLFVKQNSVGTTKGEALGPVPGGRTHWPPVRTTTRSRSAGPKNQPVKSSQSAVQSRYRVSIRALKLFRVRPAPAPGAARGLVNHEKRNTAEVQPHAFLIKWTLRKLDLEAK